MSRGLGIVVLVVLAGCPDQDDTETMDLGAVAEVSTTDSGPGTDISTAGQCGANLAFNGDCVSRCPSPCECFILFPELPGYQLCGKRCKVPGSCPEGERCAFTESGAGPVCMPWSITPADEAEQTGAVDCLPGPFFVEPTCRNGLIVQLQPVGLPPGGPLAGSLCAVVLLEACAGSCAVSDAGAAYCPGGYADAGPLGDAGTVACCSPNGSGKWSVCKLLGGVKQPPHGCWLVCCQDLQTCDWLEGQDSYGCTTWTLAKKDGGPDAHP